MEGAQILGPEAVATKLSIGFLEWEPRLVSASVDSSPGGGGGGFTFGGRGRLKSWTNAQGVVFSSKGPSLKLIPSLKGAFSLAAGSVETVQSLMDGEAAEAGEQLQKAFISRDR